MKQNRQRLSELQKTEKKYKTPVMSGRKYEMDIKRRDSRDHGRLSISFLIDFAAARSAA